MFTTTAQTVVAGEPAAVFAAVLPLGRALWGVTDDDIVDVRCGEHVIHAVPADGSAGCWISWTMADAGSGFTRVVVVHDELDDASGPPPDLDAVLALVHRAVANSVLRGEHRP